MATHTIKAGDTFTSIAAQYRTSIEVIQAANPNVKPTELQIGQVIFLSVTSTYTIKSGDTFSGIAKSLNVDVAVILHLNPGVNPTKLEVGQVIKVPASGSSQPAPPPQVVVPPPPPPKPTTAKYTIVAGDTFTVIATRYKTDATAIQNLNPGVVPQKLEIGQVINVPASGSTQPPPPVVLPPPPPPPPQPTSGKYTIIAGDTFTVIAAKHNTDAAAIQALNPGLNPNTLQVGQVINIPTTTSLPPTQPPTSNQGLIFYSGPSTSFPSPTLWSSYASLWAFNSNLMKYNNTPSEIAILSTVIPQVSVETGVDARVILCMCMQETGGSVHAPITLSPAPDFVRNTGIMQAHNGAIFNPSDPVGSITQMVRDGAGGTVNGDGLKQCLAKYGGNYYEALRAYNSGSVDRANLSNGITATGDYVSKIANRLMGRVWDNM